MELEALKASWNKLDERLAATEIVNLRVVKEVIQQKTKSAYDGIMGQNIYNFVVNMLIICVVFPYVYMNTPIQATSFSLCCRNSIWAAKAAANSAVWCSLTRRSAIRRRSG